MSDYSERGAQPVEDAAVDDPPTVDEVLAERDEREADQEGDRPAEVTNREDTSDNSLASEDDDD